MGGASSGASSAADLAEQWVGLVAVIALVVERFGGEGDGDGDRDLLRR